MSNVAIRRDRWEALGVAAILILAAWLRLGWPGAYSFGYDEARLSLMSLEMARQGQAARLGMTSSTGIPNLPGAVWLLALPFRLTSDPLGVTLGVGALGLLAVVGAWWLARRAWGAWAGLGAALAFATAPYAVLYSRAIWAQDLLPPLAVLWAVAAVLGIGGGKGWALALHVLIAGFAFQVHYAGITLLPATAWLVLRFRLWRRWPSLLIGGALAALCAWPYVRTILCCAPSVRAAWETFLHQPSQTDLTAWRQLGEMAIGANWTWLPLGPAWRWPPVAAGAMGAASVIMGALALLSLATLLVAIWRDRRTEADARVVLTALLPVWALAGPLAFTRHSSPAYHQYQLAALPAVFIALGVLFARPRRGWRAALAALLVAAALIQAAPVAQALSAVAARLSPGGWGTPLGYLRAAAQALQDGGRVVAHGYSDQAEVDADAAGFRVLFWGYPAQVVDGRAALLLPAADPAQPPHLLMTFAALPAWGELAASGAEGAVTSYPRREGEPPYMAFTVQGLDASGYHSLEPLRLANGAELAGWRARMVGGKWRLSCLWRIVGPLPEGRYHQFNHLRAAPEGEPLAIQDAPVSSAAWQIGDTLITWADFEPPQGSGPFWVDVGMYSYPQMERSPVLGRPGDPLAPIRLGPVKVE